MTILRSIRDALYTLRDHCWTAIDVARQASWEDAPVLVDLLAGGRRQGFNESPDSFYSLGFINIERGVSHQLLIPPSEAFYSVVSLHSSGQQSYFEIQNHAQESYRRTHLLEISDDVKTEYGLNTSSYVGMTQIMIRQYHTDILNTDNLPYPHLKRIVDKEKSRTPIRIIPAGLVAGAKFLSWRLKPLLAIKLIQYRLGNKFPSNQFLSMDEVVSLWNGAPETVSRMGIKSFRYLFCVFRIAEGEAIEIRYRSNGAQYFAFSLNHTWLQCLDYRKRSAYLNSFHMKKDANNIHTILVGNSKIVNTNYLDTLGYRVGLVTFREILPGAYVEKPQVKIVNLGNTGN